ncbi:rod shape-determining protein MreC [uncultured Flavobacterium sp.]|uniref:rod shape-determining protein MreC n=1 Tax=uncultured Flavobacterium sp. TaxID=165435 RepID=UPI0030EDB601
MQQIVNFFIKNSYKLLFLLLLGTSIFFTIQNNSYHKSRTISSANYISGSVYEKIDEVNKYFDLKEVNQELVEENSNLKQLLYNKKDTTLTAPIDLPENLLQYKVIQAKVIKNSFDVYDNYLTLNAGIKDGIKEDMGVINSKGVVGIIDKTTNAYATVLSILNTKSRLNAKIKNTNHFGTLTWDAKNAGYVQLVDVPRLANLKKGDTIVTGGQSVIFPENIPIGRIDKAYIDKNTNYYTISVRLFNDMTNVGFVYIIENIKKTELIELQNSYNEQ